MTLLASVITDHATVEREGYVVPLIGIPPDAVLEECDLCHETVAMREVEMSESGQMLCRKCRREGA